MNNECNIYLIRHSQGFHNINKRFNILFDPELTQIGKDQSSRSGQTFRTICPDISGFKICVSDLLRTRSTLENFLRGYYMTNNSNRIRFVVTVNPYMHEVRSAPIDRETGMFNSGIQHNCNCIQSYEDKGYQKGDEKNPLFKNLKFDDLKEYVKYS
jgi:bisphosphoglycerate-dependent phosphoglycerate mutase